MSAEQQAGPTPGGNRVVLLYPRRDPSDVTSVGRERRLASSLDELSQGGWRLVAMVDPEQYLDALQMIVDGLADVVVVTDPEHFPVIQLVSHLNARAGRPGELRTMPTRRSPGAQRPDRRQLAEFTRRARRLGAAGDPIPPQRIEDAGQESGRRWDQRTNVIRRTG